MEAFGHRRTILREWLAFFKKYQLIVAPICTEPPSLTDSDQVSAEQTAQIIHDRRMMVAISALSLPAAVVPVGIDEGLPQVVQVIGAPFTEMDCLAAAEAIEQQVDTLTPIDPRKNS